VERFTGTQWLGGLVSPRAGLDEVEKGKFLLLPGLELRPPPDVQSLASRCTDCAIPAPPGKVQDILDMLAHKITQEVVGSQSQGYFTTGSLAPISSSWRQTP
jgi:hypothetical protein